MDHSYCTECKECHLQPTEHCGTCGKCIKNNECDKNHCMEKGCDSDPHHELLGLYCGLCESDQCVHDKAKPTKSMHCYKCKKMHSHPKKLADRPKCTKFLQTGHNTFKLHY